MDKVQKPSNTEDYTPSSEPFRIYRILFFPYSHNTEFNIRLYKNVITLPFYTWMKLRISP
jgi:hypothetical protein